MGVALVRRMELAEQIATMFRARLRDMPENNLRQADIPDGGGAIPNPIGTAPGLRCEVGDKIVYAVPGVPYEMQEMVATHVLPDLLARSGETSTIVSRSLKTWGTSESALAEMVAHRLDALDATGNPTIAFLARGIEGLVVRITAKGADEQAARALVDAEEKELRAILGDLVFGVDDESMEFAVLERLRARGWSLGVAESLTGGFIGARIVNVPGASEVFRGTIGAYATEVKRDILGVTASLVVSEDAAREMADGARRVLGADVAVSVTGVAGPTEQDGVAVGTVCFGIALPGRPTEAVSTRLPGDRERIRQFATISVLNLLRQRLDVLAHEHEPT
jgi:nicotinamide-nucleotide amidase